jgi:hypothetical protein
MSWSKPSSLDRGRSRASAAWLVALYLAGCSSMDDRALSTRGQVAKGGAGARSSDLSGAGASDGGSATAGHAGSKSQTPAAGGTAGSDASDGGTDDGGTPSGGTPSGGTPTAGASSGSTQMGGASGGGTVNGGSASGDGGRDNGSGGCGDLDGDTVQDCAQTMVENARFDSVVAPWRAEAGTQQSWDARNARPAAGSGALKVSNTSVASGEGQTLGGSGQCLPAVGNRDYLLAARAFIPQGQGQGSAGLSIWFFGADDCADYLLPGSGLQLVNGTDQWLLVSGAFKSPPATRSIYVRLVTSKPFAQPSLEALFDDVLLREQ